MPRWMFNGIRSAVQTRSRPGAARACFDHPGVRNDVRHFIPAATADARTAILVTSEVGLGSNLPCAGFWRCRAFRLADGGVQPNQRPWSAASGSHRLQVVAPAAHLALLAHPHVEARMPRAVRSGRRQSSGTCSANRPFATGSCRRLVPRHGVPRGLAAIASFLPTWTCPLASSGGSALDGLTTSATRGRGLVEPNRPCPTGSCGDAGPWPGPPSHTARAG